MQVSYIYKNIMYNVHNLSKYNVNSQIKYDLKSLTDYKD